MGCMLPSLRFRNGVKPPLGIGDYRSKIPPPHHLAKEAPEPKGSNPVGVDMGMNNLLAASNGFKVKGKKSSQKAASF